MNGKISRLYFAVVFSPEVLSKKNRWFMVGLAAFCGQLDSRLVRNSVG